MLYVLKVAAAVILVMKQLSHANSSIGKKARAATVFMYHYVRKYKNRSGILHHIAQVMFIAMTVHMDVRSESRGEKKRVSHFSHIRAFKNSCPKDPYRTGDNSLRWLRNMFSHYLHMQQWPIPL